MEPYLKQALHDAIDRADAHQPRAMGDAVGKLDPAKLQHFLDVFMKILPLILTLFVAPAPAPQDPAKP
jgi:hypothetical protein